MHMDKIELVNFCDEDAIYKLLYKWCSNKFVYEWFEQRILSYDEIVKKYKKKLLEGKQKLFLINYNNKPIGLVQIYKYDDLILDELKKYKEIYEYVLTETEDVCSGSAVISQGNLGGKTAGNTDAANIYSGDLKTETISGNTSMGLKKTIYLYFFIDHTYNLANTGSEVVTDPLQDLSLTVLWSGTISNAHLTWYPEYDWMDKDFCEHKCVERCNNNHYTSIWSCVGSNLTTPTEPSLINGGSCWCKY